MGACLLDTHVLYWLQAESKRLSARARQAIDAAQRTGDVSISVFTLYELGQMAARGKIAIPKAAGIPIREAIRMFAEGVQLLPITLEIAATAIEFPAAMPRDPGDRLIAATAAVHRIPLITADVQIRASKAVKTIW